MSIFFEHRTLKKLKLLKVRRVKFLIDSPSKIDKENNKFFQDFGKLPRNQDEKNEKLYKRQKLYLSKRGALYIFCMISVSKFFFNYHPKPVNECI